MLTAMQMKINSLGAQVESLTEKLAHQVSWNAKHDRNVKQQERRLNLIVLKFNGKLYLILNKQLLVGSVTHSV